MIKFIGINDVSHAKLFFYTPRPFVNLIIKKFESANI